MALFRGVVPVAIEKMTDTDALAEAARASARRLLGAEDGLVVLVYGEPVGSGVAANTVRLVRIEGSS